MTRSILAWFLGCALAIAVARPIGAQQRDDVESIASALIASPHVERGDPRALADEWLELARSRPDHPLIEALLWLIAERREDAAEPAEFDRALLALSPQRMTAGAARQLALLQGTIQVERMSAEEARRGDDRFAGWLKHARVLGPLPPLEHPFAVLELRDAFATFGAAGASAFDGEHADARGRPIRWRALERSPFSPGLPMLDQALQRGEGLALIAFDFDFDAGEAPASAWLEIEQRGGASVQLERASARSDGWFGQLDNPSFAFQVNGGEVLAIDRVRESRAMLLHHPFALRDGRNRVLIQATAGAGGSFAVRVLGADGRPRPDVVEARAAAPLGRETASLAPLAPPVTCARFLEGLEHRGPSSEALLGVMWSLAGRTAEGLARVERARELAPDSASIALLQANLMQAAAHLPETWKRSRSRALIEDVIAKSPDHAAARIELARRLVPEDKEEDAIAALRGVAERAVDPSDALLELARVYPRLEMDAHADLALAQAFEVAPRNPRVAERLADRARRSARQRKALELERGALRDAGATVGRLQDVAHGALAIGDVELAAAVWTELADRKRNVDGWRDLAEFEIGRERWDAASRAIARAEELAPRSTWPPSARARIAGLRGDPRAEREHFERLLALDPSDRAARRNLERLGVADDVAAFLASDHGLASEPSAEHPEWNESVVREVDATRIRVLADGAVAGWTRAKLVVHDLEGCEAQGTQHPRGEVLRIATIKANGEVFEPIAGREGYVMPSLEPGDRVETITVEHAPPPSDGKVQLGHWNFASIDEPFGLSTYAIEIERGSQVEIVRRNFERAASLRELEPLATERGVIHRFEARDVARVVPEPGAPPPTWFLPSIEVGTRPDLDAIAARLQADALLAMRVTPPIERAAAAAIAGIEGDEARARALHALVESSLDKRAGGGFLSATCALLERQGNPTWLYAALLEAADIEHEVLWSRDRSPDADGDPDPAFFDESRWQGRLLVLVKPADGPQAWCDLSSRTMPYGKMLANAPRALAFAIRERRFTALPDVELEQRVGTDVELAIRIAADRVAQVEGRLLQTGNASYPLKERFRELPQNQRKRAGQQIAASVLPGIDVAEFTLEGLEDELQPMTFVVDGKVRAYLDESAGELSCPMPLPALQMAASLTGGDSERELPYFLPSSVVLTARARVELDPSLSIVELPRELSIDFEGGRYELQVARVGEHGFHVERKLVLPPLLLDRKDYPRLVDFCRRIDEAERVRVRLRR